jgi:hypothetical protein
MVCIHQRDFHNRNKNFKRTARMMLEELDVLASFSFSFNSPYYASSFLSSGFITFLQLLSFWSSIWCEVQQKIVTIHYILSFEIMNKPVYCAYCNRETERPVPYATPHNAGWEILVNRSKQGPTNDPKNLAYKYMEWAYSTERKLHLLTYRWLSKSRPF